MSAQWLELLRDRVKNSSMGRIAFELGVSRTTISLVLSGKYPARTDKIAGRVTDIYARIQCPFLAREISGSECRDFHTRETPTSSPFAMRHWRACQSCSNRRKP
jgi:hypothetical protein